MADGPIISIEHLEKRFSGKNADVFALRGIDLAIGRGDIFGIIGKSGAGKSTLVRCINMLERPTAGSVFFEGRDLCRLPEAALRKARRSMGMIFQQFNLLMQRTALQNVCFPLELTGAPRDETRKRAEELLDMVGLANRMDSYPSQLSGGQKQRVAIARALATKPRVLLCDEATSALDPATTDSILALIKDINVQLGITAVVITHEMSVIEAAQCMGATRWQIVTRVLLVESVPSLLRGLSISLITILGYTAITGSVGAGGLGNLAFRFGYQRYQKPVMYATVLLLILLVCVIQIIFDLAARKADKRTR